MLGTIDADLLPVDNCILYLVPCYSLPFVILNNCNFFLRQWVPRVRPRIGLWHDDLYELAANIHSCGR
jgi:hypothetical protein